MNANKIARPNMRLQGGSKSTTKKSISCLATCFSSLSSMGKEIALDLHKLAIKFVQFMVTGIYFLWELCSHPLVGMIKQHVSIALSTSHHVVNSKTSYMGRDNDCILEGKINPIHVFLRKRDGEIMP